MELLQAVAKKGYGKQFLDLAYVHGVPLAEKGKVTELALRRAQHKRPACDSLSSPFLPPLQGGRSAMHLVAESGHVQLMKDLLAKELPEVNVADVLQDGHFRERLHRAEQHRQLFTLKLGKFVTNKSKV